MKRSASNLIIILLLVVIIVGVIVYASDKQLAPSYAPADGSSSGDASLPAGAGIVAVNLATFVLFSLIGALRGAN